MNIFNRILAIAAAVAVMAVAAGVFLAASRLAAPGQLGALGPVVSLFDWAGQPALAQFGAAIAFFAGLLLLIMELRTGEGRRKRITVKHDELGIVSVDLGGIEELVTREARRVGGVQDVHSRVEETKNGLEIVERVDVAPDANVPEVSRELQERTKNVVEHHVGRPVSEVRVDARLARPEKRPAGSRR
jgi:uncharacterized alkaline shock family protein YloU